VIYQYFEGAEDKMILKRNYDFVQTKQTNKKQNKTCFGFFSKTNARFFQKSSSSVIAFKLGPLSM